LLHRGIAALRGGLLAHANERSAHQSLQFRLALDGKLVTQATNRFHQRAAITASIEFCKIGEADGCRPPRFGCFKSDASYILHQHFVDDLEFAAPQHLFQESPHVFRRHTPGLIRGQHLFFVFVGDLFPEFLVEQLGVGLHLDSRVGHHLFLGAQNLAQRFNLRVHAVQKLFHCVDAQLTAFVAVQRKANGNVFGQL